MSQPLSKTHLRSHFKSKLVQILPAVCGYHGVWQSHVIPSNTTCLYHPLNRANEGNGTIHNEGVILKQALLFPGKRVESRGEEYECQKNSERWGWSAFPHCVFLATLVALHFTPVNKSLGHSFGLA